jgi:hypothetical protein
MPDLTMPAACAAVMLLAWWRALRWGMILDSHEMILLAV